MIYFSLLLKLRNKDFLSKFVPLKHKNEFFNSSDVSLVLDKEVLTPHKESKEFQQPIKDQKS
jgi:hypothetical protein